MKKQLPTEAITNDLAESVFFQKPPGVRPNAGTDARLNDRTYEPANAHVSERSTLPPFVQPITRSVEQSHDRTVKQESPEKAERYSFEIYPSQKERIEEYLYQHKRKTKQKISASNFIRTAIDYYFKTLK